MGGSTLPLTPAVHRGVATKGADVFTVAGQAVSANAEGAFVIGDHTLTPGGEITVEGTTVALAGDGVGVVMGGSTLPLIPAVNAGSAAAVFTVAGQAVTALPGLEGKYAVDGTTLTADGEGRVVVDGVTATVVPSQGGEVVVGVDGSITTAAVATALTAGFSSGSSAAEAFTGGSASTFRLSLATIIMGVAGFGVVSF